MNRTQRALKKQMRKLEDGRASFKKIFLNSAHNFGTPVNSEEVKKLQNEIKAYRKETRAAKPSYSQKKNPKEATEV